MPPLDQLTLELIRAVLTGLAVTIGAFLTTRYWSAWQKRRELQLTAADSFYRLYGEFFAIWKLWNFLQDKGNIDKSKEATQWELFKRATMAEGGMEALFVKLASERNLSRKEIEMLSRFRQGYQTLRETIWDNEPIPWSGSDHPEYLSFKHLACNISLLLSSKLKFRLPAASDASAAFHQITSNEWEDKWVIRRFTDGWIKDGHYWRRRA
ncbi:MAG TPA: hypothetical protein VF527_12605 [Pyrinomonadaceae bacterium]|jgi:hypothetical protein